MIKILHTQKNAEIASLNLLSIHISIPVIYYYLKIKFRIPFLPFMRWVLHLHLKATHNDASYASSICSSSPPLFPPFHIILALNTRQGYIIATQMLRYIMAANIYDMAWPSFDPSLFQVWGGHCLDIRIVPAAQIRSYLKKIKKL